MSFESSSPSPHQTAAHSPPLNPTTKLLAAINDTTKWAVSGAVFCVLLTRRDLAIAWCVLGSIIASFINKALKHLINESRPPSARKADPGMPSSHANSLGFLGVYTALALSYTQTPGSPAWMPAGGVLALSCFLSWLRIHLGYHTVPQVLVGYGLGAVSAAAWHRAAHSQIGQVLAGRSDLQAAVYGSTAVAVVLFAVRNFDVVLRAARRLLFGSGSGCGVGDGAKKVF